MALGTVQIVPPGLLPDREAEARRVKRRRDPMGQVVSPTDIPSMRSGQRTPRAARDRSGER
jgi:hypothetical protein